MSDGWAPRAFRANLRVAILGLVAGCALAAVVVAQSSVVAIAGHEACEGDNDANRAKYHHGLGDGEDTDRFVHPYIAGASVPCPDDGSGGGPDEMDQGNVELRRADGRFRGGYFVVASADCQGCTHVHLSRNVNFPECHYGSYGSATESNTRLPAHTHFHHNFCGKVER